MRSIASRALGAIGIVLTPIGVMGIAAMGAMDGMGVIGVIGAIGTSKSMLGIASSASRIASILMPVSKSRAAIGVIRKSISPSGAIMSLNASSLCPRSNRPGDMSGISGM